jgi:hypothetical protein
VKEKTCNRAMEAIESLGDTRHRRHGWLLPRRHVRRCSDCGAYLTRMESVIETLDEIQRVSAPNGLLEAVMDCLLSRLLYESPTVEERSHGHRGLLVLAGAAGLGVAAAIALAVWIHVAGQHGDEKLASIGTA